MKDSFFTICDLEGDESSHRGAYGSPYVDERGEPVKRTRHTHPYSYDGYVQWRGGENEECNGTVYSDRLLQWDYDKHNDLCKRIFGDTGQHWNPSNRDPKKIEQFLQEWMEDPGLKLILIMEYCNASSGYPVWRLDYKSSPSKSDD